MSHVVRWVTTERGLDAADFALVAYGGAGPLHAAHGGARIAHRQSDHSARAGAFLRLWHADGGSAPRLRPHLVHAARQGVVRGHGEIYRGHGAHAAAPASSHAHVELSEIVVTRGADMRYVGQEHAVTVELPIELFAAGTATASSGISMRCTRRVTAIAPGEAAEIVSLRCTVIGIMKKPRRAASMRGRRSRRPRRSAASARFISPMRGFVETPTYDRAHLAPPTNRGPALIEEYASTTVVHPGDALEVDGFGNLIIETGRN